MFADIFTGNRDGCDFLYRERSCYACCQLRDFFYLILCVSVCDQNTWWEGGMHTKRNEKEGTGHLGDGTVHNNVTHIRSAVRAVSPQVYAG